MQKLNDPAIRESYTNSLNNRITIINETDATGVGRSRIDIFRVEFKEETQTIEKRTFGKDRDTF